MATKRFRFLTALLLLITTFTALPSNISAKSLSWVGQQMDYRRNLVNERQFKTYYKAPADNYVYYGAKFEPRSGIYLGTPHDRVYPGIKNAVHTYYDWFVPSDEIHNNNLQRNEVKEVKSEHRKLLLINWNFALKNSQIIDIRDYSNYIYNRIDEIASWGDDILLVFGKEMNIDDNFNYPELFIDCFRFVADYAHTKENIAMVWAPNDTGGLDTTLKEYYPGDDYVDWIGCSLYTMPFFQGNPNADDAANMSFIMGKYANPSIRAKMIHQFMVEENIKKPVVITEGGVGFESPQGIDYTDWAAHQLRMYYADICRMYPEFKCIISFNQYVQGDLYRYDMANNETLFNIMLGMTADPIYLLDYPSSSPYSYGEIYDGITFNGTIDISSYAYIPKKPNLVVRYLIDGQWVSEKSEPPYGIILDNTLVSYGAHTLTCEIYDGSGIAWSKNYKINFAPAEDDYEYDAVIDDFECNFKDMTHMPSHMRKAVTTLNEKGIINGVDDENFAPMNRISRAEVATILARMAGAETSATPSGLTDVSKTDWYYDTVNAAVSAGLINGYDDGTFRGGNAVTKNELVTIIARIIQNKQDAEVPDITLAFKDSVASWAEDYIKIAKANNILLERKDGLFYGDGFVGRGDAAIMIYNLMNEIEDYI